MPAAAVYNAFYTRLREQWDEADAVIVEPNTLNAPPDGAFVMIQFPVANGLKPSLGRRFFEDGGARIVLNIPVGVGLSSGLTMADELASIFREVYFSPVRTWEPSSPVINDTNDEGNWFELSVVVPYRYQFDD